MYSALTAHSPNQASMITISRIVLLPGIVLVGIVVLANVYSTLSGEPGPHGGFYLGWWLGLGFAADLVYGLSSHKRLVSRFRESATAAKPRKDNQTPKL
jgi:hypothetical protein